MRLRRRNAAIAVCIILLPTLMRPVAQTVAAGLHTNASSHASKTGRCQTRNKPSGTITFSDFQFPDTLNRYQSARLVTREILTAMFESLFEYDSHVRLIPQLARAVPTVRNGGIKDGGRTIVVQLKSGLRWSNGAEITSRDIWFGWKVGMDKATGPDCLGGCDIIGRIDTPGKYTAVLRLKQVYSAAVPDAMPDLWPHRWPGAWKDSPHAAALKLGQDPAFTFESSRFPTDGAYQVAKFVAGKSIRLRPMKYYSGMSCGGYLKNLVFVPYPSKRDLIAAAAAGKTDVTTGYNPADLTELNKRKRAYHVHAQTSFSLEHLEFNVDPRYHGKPNPLANPDVRLALALALDKYALIRNALGVSKSTAPRMAAWTPFVAAPDLKQPYVATNLNGQWDPIAAKFVIPGTPTALQDAHKLLNRTRYKAGFTLDLYTTTGSPTRLAQEGVIATSWAKLAVRVKPNYVSDSRLLGEWSQNGVAVHGSFQVAMFAYLGSPDPDLYKYNLQSRYCDRRASRHSTLNGNNSCIRDTVIDRSFTRAAATFDSASRARSYAAVARAIDTHAYWIPLYFRPTIATEDGRVAGFSINPTSLGPTWNVYAWKAKRP